MLYDDMYNAINKGIPNFTNISIDPNILISQCSSDMALLTNEIRNFRNNLENNLVSINGFAKAQFYFFDDFIVRTSYKNSETSMFYNPDTFIVGLKDILGVSNDNIDYNDLTLKDELLSRLEVLKTIKTPEELEKEFPIIYEDYLLSSRAYDKIKSTSDPNQYKSLWNYYKIYGFDTRFNVFMNHQIAMYRNFIVRRQFVEGFCNRNPLDLNSFRGLDKDKFELYVAHQYLEKAYSTSDFYTIQDCVKYLAAYVREYKTNNEENISININGEKVTFKRIFNRYVKLFRMYSELKPLDSERSYFKGYHGKHVENHIKKYYGHSVNWFIVPSEDEELFNENEREEVIDFLNRKYNYLSKEEREELIKKRYSIYDRKVKFYEKSGYSFKLMGLNGFNGYIAYIYPNGKVILDKLFDNYTKGTPAHDEALYILDIEEFARINGFSKKDFWESDKITPKYHSKKWESNVQEFIDLPCSVDTKEFLDEYKLKLKIK